MPTPEGEVATPATVAAYVPAVNPPTVSAISGPTSAVKSAKDGTGIPNILLSSSNKVS